MQSFAWISCRVSLFRHNPHLRFGTKPQYCTQSFNLARRAFASALYHSDIPAVPPTGQPSGTADNSALSPRPVSILPFEVVQRIASGQIVTGYRSIVIELFENAIDAAATKLTIDLNFDAKSITVTDNGHGISLRDGLLDVAKCNATSKLNSLQQLHAGVRTLGFRGQGLWAIAMNCEQLQISSRTKDSLHGTSVNYSSEGTARIDSIIPEPMSLGTIVCAKGLPWRLDGKGIALEIQTCRSWLQRTALCYPHVSIQFTRHGRLIWRSTTTKGDKLQAQCRTLVKQFNASPSDFRLGSMSFPSVGSVSAVIGIPSAVTTSSKSWIVTAINGRATSMETLDTAIVQNVDVKRGRYPVAVVNICVDPSIIDWNISPSKNVARFIDSQKESQVKSAVSELVRDLLRGLSIMSLPSSNHPGSSSSTAILHKLFESRNLQDRDQTHNESSGLLPTLLDLRIVGQVLQTYILVEYGGGMMIIEQHVAEERIMYEQLREDWAKSNFVDLPSPLQLQNRITEDQLFCLTSLGFEVESHLDLPGRSGKTTYQITKVPKAISQLPRPVLTYLLSQLCRDGTTIDDAAALVSCQIATKNGRTLGLGKMRDIVTGLMKCENPHTCPHGRPIVLQLGVKDLASLFGRSWSPERLSSRDKGEESRAFNVSKGILNE